MLLIDHKNGEQRNIEYICGWNLRIQIESECETRHVASSTPHNPIKHTQIEFVVTKYLRILIENAPYTASKIIVSFDCWGVADADI